MAKALDVIQEDFHIALTNLPVKPVQKAQEVPSTKATVKSAVPTPEQPSSLETEPDVPKESLEENE